MESIYWYEYTWDELKEKLKEVKAVILPIGSCEQHSLHLPLGMDTFSAIVLSEKVAERLQGKVLVLSPIWYGVSPHHMNFTGTITLSNETLISIVLDIAKSIKKHGVSRLIIINGHGGNTNALTIAIRKLRDDVGIKAVLINPWSLINDVISQVLESRIWGHACEFETSVAFIEIPDKIRTEKIKKPNITKQKIPYSTVWEKNTVILPWNTDDFTDTGAIGDPTKADKKKGEILFNSMLDRTVEFIESFIYV